VDSSDHWVSRSRNLTTADDFVSLARSRMRPVGHDRRCGVQG
jgi:hypothetical protein